MKRLGLPVALMFAVTSTVALAQPDAAVDRVLNRCLAAALSDAPCFDAIGDYVDTLGRDGLARAAKDAALAGLAGRLEAEATEMTAARVASAISIMAQSVDDPEVFDALEASSYGIINAFTRKQMGAVAANRA